MFSRGTFPPWHGGGQGSQGLESGRGRGGLDVSRGGYFGRGRDGGVKAVISDQEQDEILSARPNTMHLSSEGTDDLIVPSPSGGQIDLAMQVLQQGDLDDLQSSLQIRIFLQSCLLNMSNHHSVDTSAVLYNLASENGLAKLRHIMLHPEPVQDGGDVTSSIATFQTITLPLVGVLTRQSLCQMTLTRESSRVFGLVHELRHPFLKLRVQSFMNSLLDRDLAKMSSSAFPLHPQHLVHEYPSHQHNQRHSEDTFGGMAPSHCALLAIIRLIYQLMMRFPDSTSGIATHVNDLAGLVDRCCQQSETGNARQVFLNSTLSMEMARLSTIVQNNIHDHIVSREQRLQATPLNLPFQPVDGPGELALHGPRNDNDHAMISKISICPTREEILSSSEPFLPLNDNVEPSTHFLPLGWSRHLDVHYRLYRQDMIEPLRVGIRAFVDLLERTDERSDQDFVDPNVFRRLIKDNISLSVYRNVKFLDVTISGFNVGLTKISFDQPSKAQGLNHDDRKEFWELSRGRLMEGNLVCFVRRSKDHFGEDCHRQQVVLAVIQQRGGDGLFESEQTAHIQVSLTESASYSMVFAPAQPYSPHDEQWFMIEFPGSFFEGHRTTLRTLRDSRPSVLPFGKYIAPTDEDISRFRRRSAPGVIDPPVYTTMPGFKFDLSVLLENGGLCTLDVRDPQSVDQAVTVLRECSSLDNAQALALVETLGREVALISGPPGTGKTKVGVDLIKVLLHNKEAMNCGPILVVSYTNHALDHFLEHLLDQGVTRIVRVGSQSKSQRLQEYSLKSILINSTKPCAARRVLAENFATSKQTAVSIRDLTLVLKSGYFDWKHVKEHLRHKNPAQCRQFEDSAPTHVASEGGVSMMHLRRHLTGDVAYERWATGKDLDEKCVWNCHPDKKDKEEAWPTVTSAALGDVAPEIAVTPGYDILVSDRPILLLGGDVWSMSMQERRRLIAYWRPDIIRSIEQELERHHRDLRSEEEIKLNSLDEARRLILSGMDVIGITTCGSAKFHTLLESVAPKVILCEEAGEVVESQILTALSPVTQHLILIGDHLQLRPHVQTYSLCSESSAGQRYNLNRSLFERLVTSEVNQLPVSPLTIQQRMRPEISSLIKNTLYPTLEDGGPVHLYPDVGGISTNLFFMDHSNPEDRMYPYGLQSFSNSFEVEMIEALALHFIKNGYDLPGDIVVLTPYLGQLAKIRNHLEDRFVVLADKRDEERLYSGGAEGVYEAPQVINSRTDAQEIQDTVRNHIMICSIDNYQGEEAKIVLISLVRSETDYDDRELFGSIGFLKNPNRANVLLSRAQHGMFLIGNARVMDQPEHGIWPAVMKELQQSGRVGQGFPIFCKNHPETKRIVCSAKDFRAAAPDGGVRRFWIVITPAARSVMVPIPVPLARRNAQYPVPTPIATMTARACASPAAWTVFGSVSIVADVLCHAQLPVIGCLATSDVTRTSPVGTSALLSACSETVIETLVFDRCETIRLDEVDVDRNPLMVPPCGHALTLSTLDDLMDLGRYYQEHKGELSGSVSYAGLKELPGVPNGEVVCSECAQPIGALFLRYGRSVKHTQLLHLMERFHKKQMADNNQHCAKVTESFARAKGALFQSLSKAKASPRPVSTRSIDRRVTVQDGVLVGDLGEVASLYLIPWRHQLIWKEAIKPAEDALAFFGRSLVERSPIMDLMALLVRKSSPLSQGSQWSQRRNAPAIPPQSPPFSPSDKELFQAIRTLGLEDAVRADEDVTLYDVGSSSLILSSIFALAVEAMDAAGVESGWYWFVGDLIDCCHLYSLQYKKMALDCGDTSAASIASKMILEGLIRKVHWMKERSLGGTESTKEYTKALRELERVFRAESSERCGEDLGGAYDWALAGLEEKVMALLQVTTLQREE
ncbi:hypothetical protein KI688_003037 [Linnemannia hyalina]|uniref:P-loop containing nucleoside triphosphate hydrolase protein n=1 Tax=Linnemannia hyalina TaxID=64524 RepID=A0A9P8BR15_9FUNG|nr:hypothetical protein KI688_003037 [Linnemannia hyalina]